MAAPIGACAIVASAIAVLTHAVVANAVVLLPVAGDCCSDVPVGSGVPDCSRVLTSAFVAIVVFSSVRSAPCATATVLPSHAAVGVASRLPEVPVPCPPWKPTCCQSNGLLTVLPSTCVGAVQRYAPLLAVTTSPRR